jgi:hypothetical protein
MKAVNGYYENGRFTPFDIISLPKRAKAVLVYEEPALVPEEALPLTKQANAWLKFVQDIRACDESLGAEFDEVMAERVNFKRELVL